MQRFPRLTPGSALFLDFDGTLADLAPQPEAVHVAHGLVSSLAELYELLDGALAIVSGRRLNDIDHFLTPLTLPAACEHGAQHRHADGRLTSLRAPDLTPVLAAANGLADRHDGLRVEQKVAAVALHYRHAPALESLCRKVLSDVVARTPGLELMEGKCVLEVKPAGVNKGLAIEAFLSEPPFKGRQPVFAGDDVTDEAGFAVVQRLGGQGLKVGDGPSLAQHRCDSPQALREWLHRSVEEINAANAPRKHA
jgi:trehalose 6-phosphate phosphatase